MKKTISFSIDEKNIELLNNISRGERSKLILPYLELHALSKKRNKSVSDLKNLREKISEIELNIRLIKSDIDSELLLRKNEDIETAKALFDIVAMDIRKNLLKKSFGGFYKAFLSKRLAPLTITTDYDTEKLIELFQLWKPEAYYLFKSNIIDYPQDIEE